jgi:ribosomal protein S27E
VQCAGAAAPCVTHPPPTATATTTAFRSYLMTDAVCSKCGESAVEFDEVEGVSACQACGWVLADDQLVHATTFDAQGAPHGSFVHGGDTSERGWRAWAGTANAPGLTPKLCLRTAHVMMGTAHCGMSCSRCSNS